MTLALAHAAFVACALLLEGAAFFTAWVLPRTGAAAGEAARLRALARGAACAGLLALAAWTLAETVAMAGDLGLAGTVLRATRFGHLVIAQAVLLALAALWRAAALPASVLVLVAEALHGHGAAMGVAGLPLVVVGTLHLLAAGIWVGGLPPLLILVRRAPLAVAARAARWFSPPARLAVAGVALSALVQSALLVGSPAALTATRYGALVLAKAALFALLFGGACLNRYRFAPSLRGENGVAARTRLSATILFQTGCAIVAIVVAVILGASTPGMDMGRN